MKQFVSRMMDNLKQLPDIDGNFKMINGFTGTDVSALADMQKNLGEKELQYCDLLPSEIQGVSNEPNLSNAQLTARIAMLDMRIGKIESLLEIKAPSI